MSSTKKSVEEIFAEVKQRKFDSLIPESLEAVRGRQLAELIHPELDLYEPLLLATTSLLKRWYDWNLGFIIPHLKLDWLAEILVVNKTDLAKSEGIAWGSWRSRQ